MAAIKTIEDAILMRSCRGMDIMRQYLPEDYCRDAARMIAGLPKGKIVFTTGFYVTGHPETDGPSGTLMLAQAVRKMGFEPIIATDICKGYFEQSNIAVEYIPLNFTMRDAEELLRRLQPVCLVSIERCGRNVQGLRANARGVDISANTAPVDLLFDAALGKIATIGVGDGGNEVGMGVIARQIAEAKLPIIPCAVKVDKLVVSTTSNWGALGIAAALQQCTGTPLLPSDEEVLESYRRAMLLGYVDGETHKNEMSIDSFPMKAELEMLAELRRMA